MDMAAVENLLPLDMHIYYYNEVVDCDLTGIKITSYDQPVYGPAIAHNRGTIIHKVKRWIERGLKLTILRTEDSEIHKSLYQKLGKNANTNATNKPLKKRTILIEFEDKRGQSEDLEELAYLVKISIEDNRIRYQARNKTRIEKVR